MVTLYAKVVDGTITEFPVSIEHIKNRNHSVDDYKEVMFTNIPPIVPGYHVLKERVVIHKGNVYAEYSVERYPLESLLSLVPRSAENSRPGDFISDDPLPEKLRDQILLSVRERVQTWLDEFAGSRNYGDEKTSPTVSIVTYVNDPNPKFAMEANYFIKHRSEVWVSLYQFLTKVLTGEEEVPRTFDEVKVNLPEQKWPDEV